MTIVPVTNASVKPNPNPNGKPYTTLNQKQKDNPRSILCHQRYLAMLPEQMLDRHFKAV